MSDLRKSHPSGKRAKNVLSILIAHAWAISWNDNAHCHSNIGIFAISLHYFPHRVKICPQISEVKLHRISTIMNESVNKANNDKL